MLTRVKVSHRTQQRLVHRQTFELPPAEGTVEEMSVDGGKVRWRTPQGQPSEWRDDKGVDRHECCVAAFCQANEPLINGVKAQPLSDPLTCLGDGHDGIWNLYLQIGTTTQRRELLDWYHLIENLGKVGGSEQRLTAVEACLGWGDVEDAMAQFDDWQQKRVTTFIADRIVLVPGKARTAIADLMH